MRGLITIVVSSLCEEGLISRWWDTKEWFNPKGHHEALPKVDVVCMLQSDALSLSVEIYSVGADLRWQKSGASTRCRSRRYK